MYWLAYEPALKLDFQQFVYIDALSHIACHAESFGKITREIQKRINGICSSFVLSVPKRNTSILLSVAATLCDAVQNKTGHLTKVSINISRDALAVILELNQASSTNWLSLLS